MNRRSLAVFALLLTGALVRPQAAPTATDSAGPAPTTASGFEARRGSLAEALARVRFEPNRGQFADAAEYVGRSGGVSMFFGDSDAEIRLGTESIRLGWARAGRSAEVVPEQQLPGVVSYVRGPDPATWLTELPTYAQLRQRSVYPGIDIVYYGHAEGVEFDLAVAPNADLSNAELTIAGAQGLRVTEAGELVLTLADGALTIRQPVAYQSGAQGRVAVPVRYVQRSPSSVGFQAEAYDAAKPLVVDPVIAYSTLRGAVNEDRLARLGTDSAGNVLAVVHTNPYAAASTAPFDLYLMKLDPTLSVVQYAVFFGGGAPANCRDFNRGLALDVADNVYVTGSTNCTDFPTTPGAYVAAGLVNDAYVVKFSPLGGVVYASRFGGVGGDVAFGIGVDGGGNAYVSGATASADFPVTVGAYKTVPGGGTDTFVTKLNAAGSARVYSTFVGGAGTDSTTGIAVDSTGIAHALMRTDTAGLPTTAGAHQAILAGGADTYVVSLNAAGAALNYATYLGGTGTENPSGIAVDQFGLAYVTGGTTSINFPVTVGAFQGAYGGGAEDGTVTKLDAVGALVYSTYLGGSTVDRGSAIDVDATGQAVVAGATDSVNFPLVSAFQPVLAGGPADSFVTKFGAGGGVVWSSFLGGILGTEETSGVVVDGAGRVVVGGSTAICNTCVVNDYPTTPGAHQTVSGGGLVGTLLRWDSFVTVLLPRSLTLAPAAQVLTSPGSHAVTLTLMQDGSPVPGESIKVNVSGGTSVVSSCTTDPTGQCVFSYTGSLFSGVDTISAYADGNNNSMADFDEPKAGGTITRTYPGGGFGRIEGVVLNALNSAPIRGANVLLYDASDVQVASATTSSSGYWSAPLLPFGTYRARTNGVLGFTNELHNNIPCEPTCAVSAGAPIVLNAAAYYEGVYFYLSPLAPARTLIDGSGTHSPGGFPSSFTVNVAGPHSPSGSMTYTHKGKTFVSTHILGFSRTGTQTTIMGVGTLNGVFGASFRAVFTEGAPKALKVQITNPVVGGYFATPITSPLTSGTWVVSPAAP